MHKVAAVRHTGQEQQLFLDVRCQMVQIHDLRDAGLRDVSEAGQLGKVRNPALADEAVEADRQSHQAGDSGDASRLDLFGRPGLVGDGLTSVVAADEVYLAFDRDHAASSTAPVGEAGSSVPVASALMPDG